MVAEGLAAARAGIRGGLSARAAADTARSLGFAGLDRQRIANIEAQRGRPVGVQELLGLSYIYETWPVAVVVGDASLDRRARVEGGGLIELAPQLALTRYELGEWWAGRHEPWFDVTVVAEEPADDERMTLEEAMSVIKILASEHGLRVTFEVMDRG